MDSRHSRIGWGGGGEGWGCGRTVVALLRLTGHALLRRDDLIEMTSRSSFRNIATSLKEKRREKYGMVLL